jgi:hypothetical protein
LSENRPELLYQLYRKLHQLDLDCPGGLVLACQTLLDRASTRFQHVILRQAALLSCKSLVTKGKLTDSAYRAELAACADICQQSGLVALSADMMNWQGIDDLDTVTKIRDLLEASGHFDFAQAADGRRVRFLLERYDAIIETISSAPARRILKDMFDRESFLLGKVDLRNSQRSHLFDNLLEWSNSILSQTAPSLALACFIATFSVEAHRRAVRTRRAPVWGVGQKILRNAYLLLSYYFTQVYLGDSAPRFLENLLHDTAWQLLEDTRRVNPTVPSAVSDAAALYLNWAPIHARWGDRSGLARRLEAIQAFAENEIANDMNRRQYANAVKKCAAVLEICLYHPGRTHMRSILDTGSTYIMATNIVANDALWENNEAGRAQATLALNRVAGAWIAWTDQAGRYREPGKPRRVPGEPESGDFWTYDWVSLAVVSDLWKNPDRRLGMIKSQTQRDMQATVQSMSRDEYLKDCVERTREIFDEPTKFPTN